MSARSVMMAIARGAADGAPPVRFVHVGSADRNGNLVLPGATDPAGLQIDTRVVPLADVEETWKTADGKPRIVFTTRS